MLVPLCFPYQLNIYSLVDYYETAKDLKEKVLLEMGVKLENIPAELIGVFQMVESNGRIS